MNLYDEDRACGAEDVEIISVGPFGVKELTSAVNAESMTLVKHHLRSANTNVFRTTVKQCPFEGVVEIRLHQGQMDWECPVCRTEHREEVEV